MFCIVSHEDGDEESSEFSIVERPIRRVPQLGPIEAHCTSPKANWHQRDFFRDTYLKAGIRDIQNVVRLHTTSKKLIWLAILTSVIVPVASAASPTDYFESTTLAAGMLANIPSICIGTNLIPHSHRSFHLVTLWYGSPTSSACRGSDD